MNKSNLFSKLFLKCYLNHLKSKSWIFPLLLSIGSLISDVLINKYQKTLLGPFRSIATLIVIISFVIVPILSFYDCLKEFTSNSDLVIIHKSPIMIIDHEVSDLFKDNITTFFITLDTSSFRVDDHIQWEKGKEKQKLAFNTEIKPILSNYSKIHYIGIAEIPFSVYLGYLFSNGLPINYYQRQQRLTVDKSPWNWPSVEPPANWYPNYTPKTIKGIKNNKVALLIEFSFPISKESLPEDVQNYKIFRLFVPEITPNALISEKQIHMYGEKVKELLDRIADCDEIHLFLATPVSISFVTGQMINHSAHPECFVYVYNKNKNPPYKLALKVNEKKER